MRGEQFYDLLLSPLSHISEFRNNYRILKQTDCLFQLRRVFCTIISGVQHTICQIIHFILTTLCIYRGWEQPRSWTKLLWFTIILQFPSKQYEWLSTLFQAVIECLLKLFTCPRVSCPRAPCWGTWLRPPVSTGCWHWYWNIFPFLSTEILLLNCLTCYVM